MSEAAGPDFAALRAERNRRHDEVMARYIAQGWTVLTHHNPDACYCDCGCSNPEGCEHDWSGPEYRDDENGMSSATCARCGMLAYTHDVRCMP